MSLPAIPDLNPAAYRWHPSPESPHTTVRRRANGTEAWVGIKHENAKGQYDFYVSASLRITVGGLLSLAELKEKTAAALAHVGFGHHAEVGCEAVWPADNDGVTPWIAYTPPRTPGEALDRARGMVSARVGRVSGLALRDELGAERRRRDVPEPAASVAVYLVADVRDEATPLGEGTGVELLAHFNHVFWDGISARMMVGELLVRLGRTVEGGQDGVLSMPETDWSGDPKALGLSEPILDVCKVDVEALAHDAEFKKARDEFMGALMGSGVSITSSLLLACVRFILIV